MCCYTYVIIKNERSNMSTDGPNEDFDDLIVPDLNDTIGGDYTDDDYENKKRGHYLSWDEYFMSVAFLSAQRSKDPNTQVGACIVNKDNKIIGIGYNGMPIGCDDDSMPWRRKSKTGDILETKRLYVCHAEMNAILNKISADVKNSRIYVALFPCNECAKLIIQSRITEVVYCSDKYHCKKEFVASRFLFEKAGIVCRQFIPNRQKIVIDFSATQQAGHSQSP